MQCTCMCMYVFFVLAMVGWVTVSFFSLFSLTHSGYGWVGYLTFRFSLFSLTLSCRSCLSRVWRSCVSLYCSPPVSRCWVCRKPSSPQALTTSRPSQLMNKTFIAHFSRICLYKHIHLEHTVHNIEQKTSESVSKVNNKQKQFSDLHVHVHVGGRLRCYCCWTHGRRMS